MDASVLLGRSGETCGTIYRLRGRRHIIELVTGLCRENTDIHNEHITHACIAILGWYRNRVYLGSPR